MAEPSSPTLGSALALAALVAAFGPLVGQYVLIIVAAFGGALVALMSAPPSSVLAGLGYIGRGVLVAIFTTFPLAYGWTEYLHLPLAEVLAVASFVIGLRVDWALDKIRARSEGGTK